MIKLVGAFLAGGIFVGVLGYVAFYNLLTENLSGRLATSLYSVEFIEKNGGAKYEEMVLLYDIPFAYCHLEVLTDSVFYIPRDYISRISLSALEKMALKPEHVEAFCEKEIQPSLLESGVKMDSATEN